MIAPNKAWNKMLLWGRNRKMNLEIFETFSFPFLKPSFGTIRISTPVHSFSNSTMLSREQIADIFEKIALLLDLQDENPFKIRAYKTGAEVVENFW